MDCPLLDHNNITAELPVCTVTTARVINKDATVSMVTTKDGKCVRLFHVVLRLPPTAAHPEGLVLRLTVWKRVELYASFRAGACVQLRQVALRAVKGAFVDHFAYGLHFNGNSSVHPVKDDGIIPSGPAPVLVQKRARSPTDLVDPALGKDKRTCANNCSDPSAPFCPLTGSAHLKVCPGCGKPLDATATPYCSATGEAHALE